MSLAGYRASPTRIMVGAAGIEPATSALSAQRSNQLSYTPVGNASFVSHHSFPFGFEIKLPAVEVWNLQSSCGVHE